MRARSAANFPRERLMANDVSARTISAAPMKTNSAALQGGKEELREVGPVRGTEVRHTLLDLLWRFSCIESVDNLIVFGRQLLP